MINPVLKKEMKVRARSWKNTGMITLYAFVLVFSATVIFKIAEASAIYSGGFSPEILQALYITCAICQIFLIGLLVPATTASSISGEKQRRTFDLLICNRLSSKSIVIGKLFASLLQTFMLLILALPVLSCLFMFGGLEFIDLFKLMTFYTTTAILLGSIGLFCSSIFKTTVPSIVVSYVIIFLLTFGMLILMGVFYQVFEFEFLKPIFGSMLFLNPGTGLSAILSKQLGESFIFTKMFFDVDMSANTVLIVNMLCELFMAGIFSILTARRIDPLRKCK